MDSPPINFKVSRYAVQMWTAHVQGDEVGDRQTLFSHAASSTAHWLCNSAIRPSVRPSVCLSAGTDGPATLYPILQCTCALVLEGRQRLVSGSPHQLGLQHSRTIAMTVGRQADGGTRHCLVSFTHIWETQTERWTDGRAGRQADRQTDNRTMTVGASGGGRPEAASARKSVE
jgi:hypothetical protein